MTNKPDTITIDRPTLETLRAIAIGNKSLANKCAAQAATIARQGEIIRQLTERAERRDRALSIARDTVADYKGQIFQLRDQCFNANVKAIARKANSPSERAILIWPLR